MTRVQIENLQFTLIVISVYVFVPLLTFLSLLPSIAFAKKLSRQHNILKRLISIISVTSINLLLSTFLYVQLLFNSSTEPYQIWGAIMMFLFLLLPIFVLVIILNIYTTIRNNKASRLNKFRNAENSPKRTRLNSAWYVFFGIIVTLFLFSFFIAPLALWLVTKIR